MKKSSLLLIILLSTNFLRAQVGINTENPEATLHVNGNLKITDTPILSSATALVIDDEGNIGTAASIPAKVMLVQSINNQLYPANGSDANSLNNDNPIIVTWEKADIKTNNIVSFNEEDNIFLIVLPGIYELSGYINYKIGGNPAKTLEDMSKFQTNLGVVNVMIQVQSKNSSIWKNIAGARYLMPGPAVQEFALTVQVPPILYQLNQDDKIRMCFVRPTKLGVPHGTNSSFGIIKPNGIEFTKGLKIIAY